MENGNPRTEHCMCVAGRNGKQRFVGDGDGCMIACMSVRVKVSNADSVVAEMMVGQICASEMKALGFGVSALARAQNAPVSNTVLREMIGPSKRLTSRMLLNFHQSARNSITNTSVL